MIFKAKYYREYSAEVEIEADSKSEARREIKKLKKEGVFDNPELFAVESEYIGDINPDMEQEFEKVHLIIDSSEDDQVFCEVAEVLDEMEIEHEYNNLDEIIINRLDLDVFKGALEELGMKASSQSVWVYRSEEEPEDTDDTDDDTENTSIDPDILSLSEMVFT